MRGLCCVVFVSQELCWTAVPTQGSRSHGIGNIGTEFESAWNRADQEADNTAAEAATEKGVSMFQIGDLIVHPMHGAGVIDNVVQEKVAGKVKE